MLSDAPRGSHPTGRYPWRLAGLGMPALEGSPMYRPVPAQIDLPAMEHEVLALWESEGVFEASVEQSKGRPPWVFYEGPPTANGTPGTHHVEARVFRTCSPGTGP